jgi:hypothetical protein
MFRLRVNKDACAPTPTAPTAPSHHTSYLGQEQCQQKPTSFCLHPLPFFIPTTTRTTTYIQEDPPFLYNHLRLIGPLLFAASFTTITSSRALTFHRTLHAQTGLSFSHNCLTQTFSNCLLTHSSVSIAIPSPIRSSNDDYQIYRIPQS